jgi:hypothetical protein
MIKIRERGGEGREEEMKKGEERGRGEGMRRWERNVEGDKLGAQE